MFLKTILCDRCHAELVVEQEPLPSDDLFHSAYVPSDPETSRIQSLLQCVESDLNCYDAEIGRLSQTLETLKRRRNELQEYRDCYRTVFAPVRRLPVELLAYIFSFYCNPGLLVNDDGVEAPALVLSQTCSFWRAVAVATPELWSSLSLNLGHVKHRPRIEQLVDCYLERSDYAPLTLDVSAFHVKGDADFYGQDVHGQLIHDLPLNAWSVIQSLLDKSHRWLTASFNLPAHVFCRAEEYLADTWLSFGGSQSILHSLTLDWKKDFSPGFNYLYPLLQHAPELRDLQIRKFDKSYPLPCQWVRRLQIFSPVSQSSDLFSLLHHCPSLREISFSTERTKDNIDFPVSPPIILPELHSLTYAFMTGHHYYFDGSKLLSSITLPCLTTLLLTSGDDWALGEGVFEELRDMIQRSVCHIQVLGLPCSLFASDQELIETLSLTPAVSDFRLQIGSQYREHRVVSRNLFQRLSFHQTSIGPCILPQLKRFHLTMNASPTRRLPNFEDISTMIHSRLSPSGFSDGKLEKLAWFKLSGQLYCTEGREWIQSLHAAVRKLVCGLGRHGVRLDLDSVRATLLLTIDGGENGREKRFSRWRYHAKSA
ncbi:hypothetical protein D9758_013340 [Tetrapyrgos nigripes]|uniref:F-box domain-containing protein n=1 Tax=Tetrapyrgos nigripes TaxID=182062 RepID=A0A8H5CDH2_9AGAR|nr:hypothetical protein D9758_013340 [Tetrapyrgos nigripes]